jgi:hypothetical protein
VLRGLGRTISIEFARQGGKNELSAQLELALLLHCLGKRRPGVIIKCAPTFDPQLAVSRERLWTRIQQAGLGQAAQREPRAIRLGDARVLFLSAAPGASVVGHTADLLLEVDEAQDVDEEKFDREFRPMAAVANATIVMYGTPWDGRSLLERTKQHNLEQQRADGIRRHFAAAWPEVVAHNPSYGGHIDRERARLGERHPVFLTQYCLETIAGSGRLFSAVQRAQMMGDHARLHAPITGETYVAGLDLAGGDDEDASQTTRDSTVLTIARVIHAQRHAIVREPRLEIVEHIAWTAAPHEQLIPALIDLLRDAWRVRSCVVDATGLGETTARLLRQAIGETRVHALRFSAESKSRLASDLIGAVNGGRLKCYADDGTPEHAEFQRQADLARVAFRANRTINFWVDPSDGHDDYVVSAALCVAASLDMTPRVAVGRGRPDVGRRKSGRFEVKLEG